MNTKPGLFGSWRELWVMLLNLFGMLGFLLAVCFSPVLWRLFR